MQVITIATNLDHPFLNHLLIPSCAAAGLELTVLHPRLRQFRFRDKRAILSRYLSRCDAPDELVVFTDAYDTLFIRGATFIREAYARFDRPIVFSAEPNSWPMGPIGLALHTGPPVRPYPYLNSGGFIGRVGDILRLLTKYPDPPIDEFELLRHLKAHGYDTDEQFGHSDQYYWTLVRLREPQMIVLDHAAAIFENFTAPTGDMAEADIKAGIREFRERGKDATSYQRERARLLARLRTPSRAAQLHFASVITKTVLLDLYREGQLPRWLHPLREPARSIGNRRVRVEEITLCPTPTLTPGRAPAPPG